MKVQEILLENKKRYLLLDNKGIPIIPATKYLKYLDYTGKSSNTLKSYCYDLKLFFEFLEETKKDYKKITINDFSDFIGWLLNRKAKRNKNTINHAITVICNFYDYLYKTEQAKNNTIENLIKQIYAGSRKYTNFLYYINKDKFSDENISKEQKKKPKILTKEEIEKIYNSTTNIRDKFLIKLLFETGLKISEVLSLFKEDFICDYEKGHKIKLVDRKNLPNGTKLKEREICVSQELMDLFNDYIHKIFVELKIDSNFVFIKLKGKNIGKPMEYSDVSDLFKRIKKKTNINVYPNLLRYTHANIYYQKTKDIKKVQERLGLSQITTIDKYLYISDEHIKKVERKHKILLKCQF